MRVAIISGQPLCREALASLARSELRPRQLDVYGARAEFEAAASNLPSLVLFDPPSGGDFAAEVGALAGTAGRCAAVVMIPTPDVALARLARKHGFRGVLPKTSETPVAAAALRLVVAGGEYFPCFDLDEADEAPVANRLKSQLSRRQTEILAELEEGATNKEIARKLGISLTTVKMHVRALLNVVGARNRTEAVMRVRGGAS